MRARGCIPNDPARCTHERPVGQLFARMGAPAPHGKASLAQYRTRRMDQNGYGACTAHAAALAIWESCAAAGRPLSAVPSPAFGSWSLPPSSGWAAQAWSGDFCTHSVARDCERRGPSASAW